MVGGLASHVDDKLRTHAREQRMDVRIEDCCDKKKQQAPERKHMQMVLWQELQPKKEESCQ